jgi:pimeloyl-ACP methyl ester carboxylesterase
MDLRLPGRSGTSPAALNHVRQGHGEPLVLLHGIGGEACVWEPVMDALALEHDVIAVDLPGFGHSPALPAEIVPTPEALATVVAAFLDDLGIETAHIAGNSLGGWVALELAKAGRTRSVVGLCPAGLWRAPILAADAPVVRGRAHRLARRLRPLIPVALLSRHVRRVVLSPFVAHPDAVPYRAAWRMVRSYARATAYDATSTAMRQNHFHGGDAITVPVTLAFGDHDRLVRPARVSIRGARTVVLEGCGHIPMWDAPDVVARLIGETAREGAPGAGAGALRAAR